MVSPELMRQIRLLELKAGFLATDALQGEYASAFKGQGREFHEVRSYFPGDDVRAIDWHVTARMREPFVKVFREERQMTLLLMVDVSGSQFFGSTGRSKRDVAAELALLLAFLAARSQDRVGLVLFSNQIETYIPPARGRGVLWRVAKAVLSPPEARRQTDITMALQFANQVLSRRSLVFMLSDFIAPLRGEEVRLVAKRHDLITARLVDPHEIKLPRAGLINLVDPETGDEFTVNSDDKTLVQHYETAAKAALGRWENTMRSSGADPLVVNTGLPLMPALMQLMRRREKR